MSLVVNVSWLENHKTGRNAYYQVFQFLPTTPFKVEGSRPVTLTHWGPIKIGVHRFHRPVESGTTKVEVGALLDAKVDAKEKRGYVLADARVLNIDNDASWLVETFGAALTHELRGCMGLMGESFAAPEPIDDPDNSFMGSAIVVPDTRPAMWGVW